MIGELGNGCHKCFKNSCFTEERDLFLTEREKKHLTFPNSLSFLKHYLRLDGIIANRQKRIKDYERIL